jgi:hypothetical protein
VRKLPCFYKRAKGNPPSLFQEQEFDKSQQGKRETQGKKEVFFDNRGKNDAELQTKKMTMEKCSFAEP